MPSRSCLQTAPAFRLHIASAHAIHAPSLAHLPGYNRGLSLSAGDRLGPYLITAPLGAGGMGEVYRAHDARLGRDVAIKVLPADVTRDPARLARFEQEARAAATLNHPNILAVFDVGTGDQPYVVSELLEGETLRAALSAGALPHKRALDIAAQIARGLAAAHQKGIVHRDLKPENIFITHEGRAKILDFGLAKLVERTGAVAGRSTMPTYEADTMPGTVLGTIGYMSPEQVRGEPTDHRGDIFALGAVFYEMFSGRRAFGRPTAADTVSAILRDDPPPLPADVDHISPGIDRIIQHCIEKHPQQRFQDASDIAFALETLSGKTASSGITAAAAVPTITSRRWSRVAGIAAAALAGLALGLVVARQTAAPETGQVAFQARTFDRLPITNARFMPDGQEIVYSAAHRGYAPELYVINPNAEGPQALGISNAHLLSVSSKGELAIIADARHIAQRVYRGTLARMTLGSSPRPMLEDVREADWSPDGLSLAIIRDLGNGRDRLEYPVGTALYEASGYLSDLRVSRDGRRVAFFEHQRRFDDRGWVKVVDQDRRVTTLSDEFWGLEGLAWTPDDVRVAFSGNSTGGDVMQPFSAPASGNSRARAVFGVPDRFIVLDVARDGRWLASREDLSFDVRARVPGDSNERDLSWHGSAGARSLSRDGEWLLLVDVGATAGSNYGVVIRKTDGSRTIRLGEGDAQRLSPDGRLALALMTSPPQLVVYPVGAGNAIHIAPGPVDRYASAEWFPDSRRVFACGSEKGRSLRCYEQDLAGSPPKPLTPEGVRASLAPDGRTLLLMMPDGTFAVSSTEGGVPRPLAGLHQGDRHIGWSRDSRAVFVQNGIELPVTVERFDLATGARTAQRQLAPDAPGAVASMVVADWVDEGPWYAYNLTSLSAALFTVSGATPAR